jgi:hypothetical protein
MLTIMRLAWREADDCRWSPSVIFPALTEQRRNRHSIRATPLLRPEGRGLEHAEQVVDRCTNRAAPVPVHLADVGRHPEAGSALPGWIAQLCDASSVSITGSMLEELYTSRSPQAAVRL